MIERARERGVYDELLVEDVCAALRSEAESVDLAVAADLAVYLGDLGPLLSSAGAALRKGGLLLFNTQIASKGEEYVLLPGGRFAHGREYVEELAAREGFRAEDREHFVARVEDGQDVWCHLFVLTKRPPPAIGCC
jgi:predicted TPR repeat methyltransferase